ncbi:BrnT family toxin [Methylovulum psychrotolerans]|uniref:BrnT family toxin n=1 Tax=Methylovulum psychrotolerans TaxID=1704499 RepID=UPI001BFF0096|nr:BrnT family toxin [Methylovulum psychrotolerans]MBT9097243.1 BrnT family toxin [Methylovulum psychrotolerans]
MRFEWDDAKNKINIQKHGIDFQDAGDMFNAPLLEWEQKNALYEYGEIRFNAIGLIGNCEVFAVYTERQNSTVIRFISVRQANKYERENYYRHTNRLG